MTVSMHCPQISFCPQSKYPISLSHTHTHTHTHTQKHTHPPHPHMHSLGEQKCTISSSLKSLSCTTKYKCALPKYSKMLISPLLTHYNATKAPFNADLSCTSTPCLIFDTFCLETTSLQKKSHLIIALYAYHCKYAYNSLILLWHYLPGDCFASKHHFLLPCKSLTIVVS